MTRWLPVVVAAASFAGCGDSSSPLAPSAVDRRAMPRPTAMAAAPRIAPVVPLAPVLTVTEEDICPPLPDGRRTHPDIPVPPEDAYPGRWGEPYRPPLIDPQEGSLADELDAVDPDRIRNPYRDVEPDSLGVITNPCPGRTVVVDIGPDDVWTEGDALAAINEPITQEPAQGEPAAQAFIFTKRKFKLETGFLGDPATDWIVPGKTKINVRGEGWNDVCDRSEEFGCYWDIKEGEVVHLSFFWPAEAPRPDWRGDPDCDDGVVTMTQDIDCTGFFFPMPLQPIPVDTVHEEAQRSVPIVGTPQAPPVEECFACSPRIWLNTSNLPTGVTLATELWGIALGDLLSKDYSTGTEWQRLQHWAAAIWLSEERFSKVEWVRGQVIGVVEGLRTASDSAQSTQRQSYNRLVVGAADGCPLPPGTPIG